MADSLAGVRLSGSILEAAVLHVDPSPVYGQGRTFPLLACLKTEVSTQAGCDVQREAPFTALRAPFLHVT